MSTSTGTAEVIMPQMGVSISEGTITAWRKRTGDWIERDETILEISTDKVESEIPAPAAGRVGELLVQEGETVDCGTLLATIDTSAKPGEAHADEGPADAAAAEAPAAPASAPSPPITPEAATPGSAAVAAPAGNGDAHDAPVSPVVRRIASEHGIDLNTVAGSGRRGRVTKKDLLDHIAAGGSGAAEAPKAQRALHTESPYREEPAPQPGSAAAAAQPAGSEMSVMRKRIAEHMVRSIQTAAHCTTVAEADMAKIEKARHSGKKKLSYLAFVARATVSALRENAQLNATLEGEKMVLHDAVHLGIAVSLGDEGLVVPVIRDAHQLSHEGLAERIADVAARARSKRLEPGETQGGTFTITNPGPFGTLVSTPIINQPQVGILDLEAVAKRPVVVTDEDGNDSIAIRPMTYLCLSWDHRAIDGVRAATFLSSLRGHLEGWNA